MIAVLLRCLPLGVLALLAACASPAPYSDVPLRPRAEVRDFGLEARFSVTHEAERYSGHLSWQHRAGADTLQITSPFGQVLAEIEINPERARLTASDRRVFEAPDAERLTQEVLGYPLPVSQLASWVLARPLGAAVSVRDSVGRPQEIAENGWRLVYEYLLATPDALPASVTASRAGGPELRLRIEDWSTP
ncbi:MAG: outer membrane lipoprotein LolB [Zoogloeaceae bacterium]|nr:outer membrane lipoprotein LolB [Zoogloeaceae bacterium]